MTSVHRVAAVLASTTIALAGLACAAPATAMADAAAGSLDGLDFGSLGPRTNEPGVLVAVSTGFRGATVTMIDARPDPSCIETPGLDLPGSLLSNWRVTFTARHDASCGPGAAAATLNFDLGGGERARIRVTSTFSGDIFVECESRSYCEQVGGRPRYEFRIG
ncbi:hypothetical protein OK17_21070 [Gordonia sp. GN26]